MSEGLPARLVGMVLVNIVVAAGLWAIVQFGIGIGSLSQDVMQRADGNPALLVPYLDDVQRTLVRLCLVSSALAMALAIGFLIAVHRDPPFGDQSARSKRPLWLVLLAALLGGTIAIFAWKFVGDPVAGLVVSSVGTLSLIVPAAAGALAYWVSTAAFVRPASRPSVPGAVAVLGR